MRNKSNGEVGGEAAKVAGVVAKASISYWLSEWDGIFIGCGKAVREVAAL